MPVPPIDPAKDQLLDAILPHVAFDGWSDKAFKAAVTETGLGPDHARALCPRGAVDLAVAYHRRGDQLMIEHLLTQDIADLRIRERIARALRVRLDVISDKEAVRRGWALFALPHLAPEGARLIWGTADAIWEALEDPSDDINWYTKRATLAGVYASTVLYWLGDDSLDAQASDAFIDRRIEDVMRIEKAKAQIRGNPLLKPVLAPANRLMSMVKAPSRLPGVPGSWTTPR